MSHTVRDKKKLVNRIRRLRGQLEAVERGLTEEADPFTILQTVVACRGALSGLMAEILEGHIREHVIDPKRKPTGEQVEATEQLVEIIRTYLR